MQAILAVTLAASIDLTVAERTLRELERLCAADGGRLWGRSLCGPVVVADPKTREAVTLADGEIGTARLPESIGIANTAVEWDGRRWTMVTVPASGEGLTLATGEGWSVVEGEREGDRTVSRD